VFVACCLLIGLAPLLIAPILGKGVSAWAPDLKDADSRLVALAPLDWITVMGVLLITALLATGTVLWVRLRRSVVDKGATWGCGYIAPTPRMQYTSSSFAQLIVGLFSWALRPRTHKPKDLSLFPQQVTAFHSTVPDTVLEEAVLPVFRLGAWLFSWFRVFQQGSIQTYLLYIFIALIALLVCLANSSGPMSFTGELSLVARLFGLCRFFTAAAALGSGSSFVGVGAAREVAVAGPADPAFFLGLLVLAKWSAARQPAGMLG